MCMRTCGEVRDGVFELSSAAHAGTDRLTETIKAPSHLSRQLKDEMQPL
jgi:hypothetical protein